MEFDPEKPIKSEVRHDGSIWFSWFRSDTGERKVMRSNIFNGNIRNFFALIAAAAVVAYIANE